MRRLLMSWWLWCLAGGLGLAAAASAEPPAPQRIASLNLCLDALLLKLVDAPRISSLTYLSVNPQFSPFANQARYFPHNRGLAEDLVAINPDLILAGDFGAADAKTMLSHLGYRVETLPLPQTLTDISHHIRHFGRLVASEAAAEQMAQELERELQRLDHQPAVAIPAYWYSANGVVVGADTLENELMTRAGFHNLAVDRHIQGFAPLDLESIMLDRPRVIIMEESDAHAYSLAQEYLQHPALQQASIKIIHLPATLSVCIAPVAADVIRNLIEQTQALAVQPSQ